MSIPKLSLIMPGKNVSNFIEETIQSILDQTFSDWELIFVNDHSDDETAQKVLSFKDDRIRYFDLISSTGVSAGRDFAIKKTSSNIIVIADSDDINYPARLETIYRYFTDSKKPVDVFYSNADMIYVDTNEKITRPFQPFEAEVLKLVNFIPNPTAAFRKESYLKVGGFDENLKMSEDYDLWLSLSEKGCKFGYSQDSLVCISRYIASTTGGKKEDLKKYIKQVRAKHGLDLIIRPDQLEKKVTQEVYQYFTTTGGLFLWFS